MRIRFSGYQFAPSGLMLIFAVLSFALFVALGRWQLERAEYKRDIESRYLQRLGEPYRPIGLDAEPDRELIYRKVLLDGRYRMDRVLLVDNKLHRGQAGYHVLVPFELAGRETAVLVNRGWVAAGYDRSLLPALHAPLVDDQVKGIVTIPSSEGYRMGEVQLTGHWPQVIPYVDMARLQLGLDLQLLPYVIWLGEDVRDVYERDWQPVWSPPEKSEAYAVQWFSFDAIVVILLIVLNLKRIDTGKKHE